MNRTAPLALIALATVSACLPPRTGAGEGSKAADGTSKAAVTPAPAPGTKPVPAPAMPGKNVPAVKVNTVGYALGWRKLAIFNVEPKNAVVKDAAGKVVFTAAAKDIVAKGRDKSSNDDAWQVDFSAVDKAGKYTVEGDGAKSDVFEIGAGVYKEALEAGLKQFYFQRDRTALVEPFAVWKGDKFLRPGVAHAHDDIGWEFESFPEKNPKTKWKPEKGWHDAGNYDLYVPSQAPTVQALYLAYELNPALFPDKQLNLPESGNKTPDILDEAAWGQTWILSMQDKAGADAGGFRVRETNLTQDEIDKPDKDLTTRWIDFVGSASTAKGCGTAATSARLFAKFDPAFAKRNEVAAKAAWAWLEKHPERVLVKKYMGAAKHNHYLVWDDGDKAPSDIGGRFHCAVEYWRAFRDPKALELVRTLLKHEQTSVTKDNWLNAEWKNVTRWGMLSLTLDKETPKDIRAEAVARVLKAADLMRETVESKDGYRCAHEPTDYYWASNSTLLEKAQLFFAAAALDPKGHGWALEAARDQWHWILGRNPNGFSMITRVGKGPTALYHQEWGSHSPKLPPGYLVGGPNAAEMKMLAPDAPAKTILWDNPTDLNCPADNPRFTPAHNMWHSAQCDLWAGGFLPNEGWDIGWFAVTEGDIYYNANLVLAATYAQK